MNASAFVPDRYLYAYEVVLVPKFNDLHHGQHPYVQYELKRQHPPHA